MRIHPDLLVPPPIAQEPIELVERRLVVTTVAQVPEVIAPVPIADVPLATSVGKVESV